MSATFHEDPGDVAVCVRQRLEDEIHDALINRGTGQGPGGIGGTRGAACRAGAKYLIEQMEVALATASGSASATVLPIILSPPISRR